MSKRLSTTTESYHRKSKCDSATNCASIYAFWCTLNQKLSSAKHNRRVRNAMSRRECLQDSRETLPNCAVGASSAVTVREEGIPRGLSLRLSKWGTDRRRRPWPRARPGTAPCCPARSRPRCRGGWTRSRSPTTPDPTYRRRSSSQLRSRRPNFLLQNGRDLYTIFTFDPRCPSVQNQLFFTEYIDTLRETKCLEMDHKQIRCSFYHFSHFTDADE